MENVQVIMWKEICAHGAQSVKGISVIATSMIIFKNIHTGIDSLKEKFRPAYDCT